MIFLISAFIAMLFLIACFVNFRSVLLIHKYLAFTFYKKPSTLIRIIKTKLSKLSEQKNKRKPKSKH